MPGNENSQNSSLSTSFGLLWQSMKLLGYREERSDNGNGIQVTRNGTVIDGAVLHKTLKAHLNRYKDRHVQQLRQLIDSAQPDINEQGREPTPPPHSTEDSSPEDDEPLHVDEDGGDEDIIRPTPTPVSLSSASQEPNKETITFNKPNDIENGRNMELVFSQPLCQKKINESDIEIIEILSDSGDEGYSESSGKATNEDTPAVVISNIAEPTGTKRPADDTDSNPRKLNKQGGRHCNDSLLRKRLASNADNENTEGANKRVRRNSAMNQEGSSTSSAELLDNNRSVPSNVDNGILGGICSSTDQAANSTEEMQVDSPTATPPNEPGNVSIFVNSETLAQSQVVSDVHQESETGEHQLAEISNSVVQAIPSNPEKENSIEITKTATAAPLPVNESVNNEDEAAEKTTEYPVLSIPEPLNHSNVESVNTPGVYTCNTVNINSSSNAGAPEKLAEERLFRDAVSSMLDPFTSPTTTETAESTHAEPDTAPGTVTDDQTTAPVIGADLMETAIAETLEPSADVAENDLPILRIRTDIFVEEEVDDDFLSGLIGTPPFTTYNSPLAVGSPVTPTGPTVHSTARSSATATTAASTITANAPPVCVSSTAGTPGRPGASNPSSSREENEKTLILQKLGVAARLYSTRLNKEFAKLKNYSEINDHSQINATVDAINDLKRSTFQLHETLDFHLNMLKSCEQGLAVDSSPPVTPEEDLTIEELTEYFEVLIEGVVFSRACQNEKMKAIILIMILRVVRLLNYFMCSKDPSHAEQKFNNVCSKITGRPLLSRFENLAYRTKLCVQMWETIRSDRGGILYREGALMDHAGCGSKYFQSRLKKFKEIYYKPLVVQQQQSASGFTPSVSGAQYQPVATVTSSNQQQQMRSPVQTPLLNQYGSGSSCLPNAIHAQNETNVQLAQQQRQTVVSHYPQPNGTQAQSMHQRVPTLQYQVPRYATMQQQPQQYVRLQAAGHLPLQQTQTGFLTTDQIQQTEQMQFLRQIMPEGREQQRPHDHLRNQNQQRRQMSGSNVPQFQITAVNLSGTASTNYQTPQTAMEMHYISPQNTQSQQQQPQHYTNNQQQYGRSQVAGHLQGQQTQAEYQQVQQMLLQRQLNEAREQQRRQAQNQQQRQMSGINVQQYQTATNLSGAASRK